MTTTQTLQIGDRVYTVSQLPAMRAQRLLPRLLKAVGPAVAALLASGASLKDVMAMDLSKVDLGAVVKGLAENLTPDEYESLLRELLSTATLGGKDLMPQFDIAMQGRVGEVFQLLKFAFQVNYRNF